MAYIKISELDPLLTGLTDNVLIPLALVNDTYNVTASMIKKYVMGEIVSITPAIPGGIYEIQCIHLFKRLVTTTHCELIIEDCPWADQSWVEFSNHSSSICEIIATPLLTINGSTNKTFYIQPESTAILKKTTGGWDLHGVVVEHNHIIADVTGLQTALDSKLSSFTEADPVFTASPSFGITGTNITNWNSAFSWGNHVSAGYLTSFTETDPVFTASPSFNITNTNITNWNSAFSWGNHASAGYQAGLVSGTNIKTINGTSVLGSGDIVISTAVEWADILNKPLTFTPSIHNHVISDVTGLQTALDSKLSSFTEVDPVFTASAAAGITNTNITNWNSAFSWGNHVSAGYLLSSTAVTTYQPLDGDLTSIAGLSGTTGLLRKTGANTFVLDTSGYLTSFTEVDPVFTASPSFNITNTDITNWNSAFSWGNHASAGYQAGLVSGTNIKTINGTSVLGSGDITISASGSVEWVDVLNKPLTFTPSTHSHIIADVTGLQTALDSKLSSFTEVDPVFTASPSFGITGTNITNWNSAFSWGNHSSVGYLLASTASTTYQPLDGDLTSIASLSGTTGVLRKTGANTFVLDTAVYLTSFTETDPVFTASPSFGITNTNITNWNSAFSWGNHASAGYQAGLVSGTNIKTINGTSVLGSGDIVISGGSGGGFFYGETTPVSPVAGDRWVKPSTATEYTYINDGDSFAWVDLNSSGVSSGLVQVFIQDTTPVASGPYLWVQTGIGGGDFSLWFNDGV